MNVGYHRPRSVGEALRLRQELGEGACFLGGGTWLNAMRPQWRHLVEISSLGLRGVEASDTGLDLGATATLQEVIDNPDSPAVLRAALSQEASRNIRNQSTIGGRLVSGRHGSGLHAILLALGAQVEVADEEASLVTTPLETWRADQGHLVLRVRVPRSSPPRSLAFERFTRSSIDLAVATVGVSLGEGGAAPIVAVGGMGGPAARLQEAENMISQGAEPDEVGGAAAATVSPVSDTRGGADWKRQVVAALVARALRGALSGRGGSW